MSGFTEIVLCGKGQKTLVIGYYHIAHMQFVRAGVGAAVRRSKGVGDCIIDAVEYEAARSSEPIFKVKLDPDDFLSGDLEADLARNFPKRVAAHRGEDIIVVDRKEVALVDPGLLRPLTASAIVYTQEAFLADPQVTAEDRQAADGYTHIIVTFLASRGPVPPPFTSHRLVRNLAGGNNDFLPGGQYASYEAFVKLAAETVAYEQAWMLVG
jgi:hypothetical protein